MEKVEKIMLCSFLVIFILLACLYAIEGNGMKKVIQMQQVIEISGAASDTEVEQVGELFGVKPTLSRDYSFWELVSIGSKDDPSPVEIANVIADIKTNEK